MGRVVFMKYKENQTTVCSPDSTLSQYSPKLFKSYCELLDPYPIQASEV